MSGERVANHEKMSECPALEKVHTWVRGGGDRGRLGATLVCITILKLSGALGFFEDTIKHWKLLRNPFFDKMGGVVAEAYTTQPNSKASSRVLYMYFS